MRANRKVTAALAFAAVRSVDSPKVESGFSVSAESMHILLAIATSAQEHRAVEKMKCVMRAAASSLYRVISHPNCALVPNVNEKAILCATINPTIAFE